MIYRLKRLFFTVFILLLLTAGCSTPSTLPISIPATPPPVQSAPPPKVVLVLGGGGTRGLAHVGVLKVLQQHAIPIDMIIGTDSGSIVGSMYASDPNVKRIQRKLLRAQSSDLIDISALHALEGPITGNALQNFIFKNVYEKNINQLPIRFVAIATDLKTGQNISLASGPIAPAVNASCALPPYFHPVNLYSRTLIDGMITDPVAVDVAKSYQPKIIIAVNVSASLPKQMPTNIVGIYDRNYIISDRQFNAYCAQDADVIIHPNVPEINYPDTQEKLAMIHAGEKAAIAALPQICAELQKNNIASDCSHVVTPPAQKKNLRSKILQFIYPLRLKMRDFNAQMARS